MSLAITTIVDSISKLVVSGLTIRDLDQIPEAATVRDCPVLYPRPEDFVTGLAVERDSMGAPSVARKTVLYTLNYRFLFAPVGSGRGLFDVYDDMVAMAFKILDAIIANDTISGLVDLEPQDALAFGPVADPAGNVFHGCDFALRVTEFVN